MSSRAQIVLLCARCVPASVSDHPPYSHRVQSMVRKHDPNAAHLRVRMAAALLRKLDQAARKNNRSMNAELVARIEQSFQSDEVNVLTEANVRKMLAESHAKYRAELDRLEAIIRVGVREKQTTKGEG